MAYNDVLNGMLKKRRAAAPKATGVNFGDANSMQAAAQDQYAAESGYGSDATATYLARAKAFDPSAAVQNYAQGAWGSISDALDKSIQTQRGAEVGAGRFDTGFNDEDTGNLYQTATKQLADSVAQQSVSAAGMQLSNNNQIGQFAQSTTQDANDLLASEREFQANEAERKRKEKSGKGAAIGGVIGAVGGSFIPGVGTAIGGTIGSAIGGLF